MHSKKLTQSLTMAFTFLRSYQPDTEHPEEEEEDEMPMARSGSVRAFSHLPVRAEDAPPQGVVGRNNGTRPYNPMPVHADEMPMARSGSVRAISHLPDSTENAGGAGGHLPPGPAAAPQARGQGEAQDSGFVFHPQAQDDDHDPDPGSMDHPGEGRSIDPGFAAQAPEEWGNRTRDSGFDAAGLGPAAGSAGMTGLPKSLLFEKRLPPGFRATSSGQPRSLADQAVPQDRAVRSPGSPAAASRPQDDAQPVAPARDDTPQQMSDRTGTQQPSRPTNAAPASPRTSTQDGKPGSQSPATPNKPIERTQENSAVKNNALIQKDKIIPSSTVPRSQRGVAVLREFFNPDANSIEQLNDSMRKGLADGKSLVVLINSNGEHSGTMTFHLDEKGGVVSTLYDPAGSYNPKGEKGSGDVLTNTLPAQGQGDIHWSLADYIQHHSKDGSMSFVPIWTDAETARNLDYPPNTMGLFCALSAGDVIRQIPGISKSGVFGPVTPSGLSNQLYQGMGRRVTIDHKK